MRAPRLRRGSVSWPPCALPWRRRRRARRKPKRRWTRRYTVRLQVTRCGVYRGIMRLCRSCEGREGPPCADARVAACAQSATRCAPLPPSSKRRWWRRARASLRWLSGVGSAWRPRRAARRALRPPRCSHHQRRAPAEQHTATTAAHRNCASGAPCIAASSAASASSARADAAADAARTVASSRSRAAASAHASDIAARRASPGRGAPAAPPPSRSMLLLRCRREGERGMPSLAC